MNRQIAVTINHAISLRERTRILSIIRVDVLIVEKVQNPFYPRPCGALEQLLVVGDTLVILNRNRLAQSYTGCPTLRRVLAGRRNIDLYSRAVDCKL